MKPIILLFAASLIFSNASDAKFLFQTQTDTIRNSKYLKSGEKKLDAKKYAEAITDFTKAINENKKNWKAYRYRADAEDGLDDYKSAIKDYTTALRLNPSDTLSYRGRAEAKRHSNDVTGAIKDYDIALLWNSRDTFLRTGRALCNYQLKNYLSVIKDLDIFFSEWKRTSDPIYKISLIERGHAYLYDHQYYKAIQDFKRCFKLGYNEKAVYMNIGRAYYYLRDQNPSYLDSAIENYKIAAPIYVDVFSSYYYLGQAYADKHDYAQSEENLQKALAVKPNHVDALFVFITVKIRQRKFEEGYDLFQRYLKLTKGLKEGAEYLYLGIAKWGAKQDTVGALQDFETASKLGGIEKGIFDNQFLLLFGNKKYAAKVKMYVNEEMSHTTSDLKRGCLFAARSLINVQLNNNAEAQADLTKAYELAPKSPIICLVNGALGKSLSLSSESVLQNYDKAIALDAKLYQAYLMKSYYFRQQGDLKKSCENLTTADQLGAKSTETLKEYLCKGSNLKNSSESGLNFVIYPYLKDAIVNFKD